MERLIHVNPFDQYEVNFIDFGCIRDIPEGMFVEPFILRLEQEIDVKQLCNNIREMYGPGYIKIFLPFKHSILKGKKEVRLVDPDEDKYDI